jgi:hypothetical protein
LAVVRYPASELTPVTVPVFSSRNGNQTVSGLDIQDKKTTTRA